MNFKIMRWFLIFIGMQILTLSIIGGYSLYLETDEENGIFAMNKTLISVKNSQNKSSKAFFTLEDINGLNDYSFTFTSVSPAETANGTSNIIGTNSAYINFNNLKFSSGSFFDKNADLSGEKVAIIDEKLAWDEFGSIKAVGNTLEISGVKFKVIGVISENNSIVGLISGSGLPNAFIPVKALFELDKTAKINSLQIQNDDTTLSGQNLNKALHVLNIAGKAPGDYYISDLNIKKVVIGQKPRIIVFFIGLACIFTILITFIDKLKGILLFIKNKVKTDYIINILKDHKKIIILQLLELLLFSAIIILILGIIKFDIYIPPESLPKELTDFNFYLNLFKKSIEEVSLNKGYLPSLTEIKLNSILSLSNRLFFTGLFIGFPILFINLKYCRVDSNNFNKEFLIICIIFIISTGLSSSIVFISGMTQKLHISDLAVLFSFNYILLIKNLYKKGKEKVKDNEKNMPYYPDGTGSV